MPIDQFTEDAYQGLLSGKERIPVGAILMPGAKETIEEIVEKRATLFGQLAAALRGRM